MSALNRQTSKSTELLHVTSQEASGGARRSWDSLVAEKTSAETGGFNGENRLDRARFSVCGGFGVGVSGVGGGGLGASTPPAISGVLSPWFGSPSLASSSSGDQSPRLLGTMPRNIVALLDRPVTYEEELEDRMGLLRVSATTLCQRLASERKKGAELAKQQQARETNYRGTVERMREQYDQRFERLKSRARLLVRRCEFLRNEKQMAEQRLAQVIESGARERQGMERRLAALQEEIERLKKEKDERRDIQTPRATEEEDEGEEDDDLGREKEKSCRKEAKLSGSSSNGLDNESFKILLEIAVARVSLLEHWIVNLNSSHSTMTKHQHQQQQQQQQQRFGAPPSLTRRTSSCPMIAVSSTLSLSDNESLHSNENQPEEESVEPDPSNPGDGRGAIDRTVLRRPGGDPPPPPPPPSRRPLATRSMPPTTGRSLPILPSTIRTSLQKFFHGGKSNQSEAQDAIRCFEIPSDDDESQNEATKFDHGPKRERGRASPRPAKRHSSLPKNELLKKLQQHGGGHDVGLSPPARGATLPPAIGSAPPTPSTPDRIHETRLNRSSADDIRFTHDYYDDCLTTTGDRTDCRADGNSTESLPDKVEDDGNGEGEREGEGEGEESKAVKRHLSVHSTFGRLHHRRNGVTNVERIEEKKKTKKKKTSKTRPTSAFDSLGKNLKQYLH